ncbi:MAG TPA: glycoside hydrolase family 3 N-terminal domain-containing protein, partial [Thermoleophilaceae bacterium]|nr:glycoside hydrolase family 3 N-terminal domain-containing protein [Thermoleophilaceae bacterium]
PPARERPQQARPAPAPGSSARVRGLPLERRVAQLFLLGFSGQDLNAEIFRRLGLLDIGGIVIDSPNYTDPAQLAQMAGEAGVIAARQGHLPPWVMAMQEGGEFNAFEGLPPASAPGDLGSPEEAAEQAGASGQALRELGVSGVLGPALDVGLADGSALGARVFSDEPAEVAAFGRSVIAAYRRAGIFSAARHFPGLGAADASTEQGPASVGLGLAELRRRDLRPFKAAVAARVPGVVLGHGLYPMTDYVTPASLSRAVSTNLLRRELGFRGLAITDDLADPAITTSLPVADAAVKALRAGADMLFISGPPADQQAAYVAVLRAVRRGTISRRRVDEAVGRSVKLKREYRLLR